MLELYIISKEICRFILCGQQHILWSSYYILAVKYLNTVTYANWSILSDNHFCIIICDAVLGKKHHL